MTSAHSKRLSVHHIGGREGSGAFPHLEKFDRDIISVLYDADPDCLAQVQALNEELEAELHVLPFCVGDACKSTVFNINYDPFTSSLRDLDEKYGSFYMFAVDHDYPLSETLRTVEKRSVDLVSLDYLLESKTITVPPPDFLSIDTQGSEFEILQGAKTTLRSGTLALVLEVSFHPIYKDQKLFGDITEFLSQERFNFVSFLHIGELAPFRGPLGLRARGFQMYGDALFLKDIDAIEKDDEFLYFIMLQKLAFIAILFNQFEYALECLRRSEALEGFEQMKRELDELSYGKFLSDLRAEIARVPPLFPETFGSKYTVETSRKRFEVSTTAENHAGGSNQLRMALSRAPRLLFFLRKVRGRLSSVKQSFDESKNAKYSDVEALMIEHGLKEQADILRANRIKQAGFGVGERGTRQVT